MTTQQKHEIVAKFLQGESATDISAFYAIRRSTVEHFLRQAMFSLMQTRETPHVEASDAH